MVASQSSQFPEASTLSAAARRVVALGASAGGLRAISAILSKLPASFPAPIVIVQHLSPHTPSQMAHILSRRTSLRVKQAEEGDRLQAGTVYIAPPARHLVVRLGEILALTDSAKIHHCRPSADVLFSSLATSVGSRSVGVVLTGGDGDGTAGIEAIKAAGGMTFAQDEQSSQNFSMPRHAAASGAIDFVLPLLDIAPALITLVKRQGAILSKSSTDTEAAGTALDRIQAAWQRANAFLEESPRPDQINKLVTNALMEMEDCLDALVMAEKLLIDQNKTLENFSRKSSEERLLRRNLLNAVSEGIIVTDSDGIMREVNSAAANLLGRSAKGMIGRPFARLSHTKERFVFEGAMMQALRGDGDQQALDLRALRDLPAVIATPSLSRNEQDVPIGLIWLLRLGSPERD